MKKACWVRLGEVLHYLSYLKLAFYGAGVYYQLQSMFFGSREDFAHNLSSTMLMYGLAMLLEALRDNESVARKRGGAPRNVVLMKGVIVCAVPLFLFATLVGIYMLFRVGDRYLGESIIAFGVGGLALMRLEYDCINLAQAPLEAPAPTPPTLPAEAAPSEAES